MVEVHRQRSLEADVGDVVNVVRSEGPSLAGDQGPVDPAVTVQRLLAQGAGDGEEGTGGLAVIMPSGVGADGPGEQPDLEVGTGVELDPTAFSWLMIHQAGQLRVRGEQACGAKQLGGTEPVDAGGSQTWLRW